MKKSQSKPSKKQNINPKNNILVNATAAMKVSTAILPETCTGGCLMPTREHKNY